MSTPQQRLHNLIRLCLLVLLCTGALAIVFAVTWPPICDVAAVDVVLTPEELRDPTLIEIVKRTLAHRPPAETDAILGIAGIVVFCVSFAALIMYERLSRNRKDEQSPNE